MTTSRSTVGCIIHLLQRVPELQSRYDEHIDDYDALLPHVFLGDVTRYVVQQIRSGETGLLKPVGRIFDYLEQCMASGDQEVQELISVSFLENLAEHSDVVTELKGLIGPNLARELNI